MGGCGVFGVVWLCISDMGMGCGVVLWYYVPGVGVLYLYVRKSGVYGDSVPVGRCGYLSWGLVNGSCNR